MSGTIPGGIVGTIVPGRIVGARSWINWTGRHALRFRIVEREMNGLGLLNLGCVDHTTVRTQWSRWSAISFNDNRIRDYFIQVIRFSLQEKFGCVRVKENTEGGNDEKPEDRIVIGR